MKYRLSVDEGAYEVGAQIDLKYNTPLFGLGFKREQKVYADTSLSADFYAKKQVIELKVEKNNSVEFWTNFEIDVLKSQGINRSKAPLTYMAVGFAWSDAAINAGKAKDRKITRGEITYDLESAPIIVDGETLGEMFYVTVNVTRAMSVKKMDPQLAKALKLSGKDSDKEEKAKAKAARTASKGKGAGGVAKK